MWHFLTLTLLDSRNAMWRVPSRAAHMWHFLTNSPWFKKCYAKVSLKSSTHVAFADSNSNTGTGAHISSLEKRLDTSLHLRPGYSRHVWLDCKHWKHMVCKAWLRDRVML
jgi:hypothetical protein